MLKSLLSDILKALENNPKSSLSELREPELLSHGFLTQDEELTKKFSDLFNAKQSNTNELIH